MTPPPDEIAADAEADLEELSQFDTTTLDGDSNETEVAAAVSSHVDTQSTARDIIRTSVSRVANNPAAVLVVVEAAETYIADVGATAQVLVSSNLTSSQKNAVVTSYFDLTVGTIASIQEANLAVDSKTTRSVANTMAAGLATAVDNMVLATIDDDGVGKQISISTETTQGVIQAFTPADLQVLSTARASIKYPGTANIEKRKVEFDLPASVLSGSDATTGVAFMELDNAGLFFDTKSNVSSYQITSAVIVVELASSISNTESLRDPVCGVYEWLTNLNTSTMSDFHSPKCVFYNTTEQTWSDSGCSVAWRNASQVQCCCSHLTSFAVLVSSDTHADTAVLDFITFVGSIISIACIVLSLSTILADKKLRGEFRYQILFNMLMALGAAQIMFFFVAENFARDSLEGCRAVSVLLLYSLLSYFLWMTVESWLLYKTFVVVFEDRMGKREKLWRACLFAWGLPAALVPILAMDTSSMVTTAQDSLGTKFPSLCWLNMNEPIRFLWLMPMGVALAINLVIGVMIVIKIRKHAGHGKELSVVNTAKIAASVASVTGMAWVFATLLMAGGGEIFAYLFTATFATQGVAVFYFHVWNNKDAMRQLKRLSGASSSKKGKVIRMRRGGADTESGSDKSHNNWREQILNKLANDHSELQGSLSAPESQGASDDSWVARSVADISARQPRATDADFDFVVHRRRSDESVGSGVSAAAMEGHGVPPDLATLKDIVPWLVDSELEEIPPPSLEHVLWSVDSKLHEPITTLWLPRAAPGTMVTVDGIADLDIRSDSYHAATVTRTSSALQLDRSSSGTGLLHSNV